MMGMNGVGSAGMTPEMMAYYQQQQLLAANNGGTASVPRFAPTQFGQVPPEFKPEDTNSAFWTPTLVGAGVGTIGAGIGGTLAYNDARRKFVDTHMDGLVTTENASRPEKLSKAIKGNLETNKETLKDIGKKAGQQYDAANTNATPPPTQTVTEVLADPKQQAALTEARKNALLKHLKEDYKGVTEIETSLKKGISSPQEIIDNYIHNNNEFDAQQQSELSAKVAEIYSESDAEFAKTVVESQQSKPINTKERQAAIKQAVTEHVKAEQAKIATQPEFVQLDKNAGKAHVLGVGVDDVTKNTETLKKAQNTFSKSVLESAEHNPNGKKLGLSKAGGRAATVFAIATTVGAGIGLWNASQASSRNEDKATQLAALRQQEAGSANAGGSNDQQIAMDMADNGKLDGSAKGGFGFVSA